MPALRNQRTAALLATNLAEARTTWRRFMGLMGQSGLPEGEGLLIDHCQSIHSCFMRFPFDAAFIDQQGAVVHTIHAMRPWRVSRLVGKAKGVVELPAGVLQATNTQVGDVLVKE